MSRRPTSPAQHTVSVKLTDDEVAWLDRSLNERRDDVVAITGQATRSAMLRLLVQEGMGGRDNPASPQRWGSEST